MNGNSEDDMSTEMMLKECKAGSVVAVVRDKGSKVIMDTKKRGQK